MLAVGGDGGGGGGGSGDGGGGVGGGGDAVVPFVNGLCHPKRFLPS